MTGNSLSRTKQTLRIHCIFHSSEPPEASPGESQVEYNGCSVAVETDALTMPEYACASVGEGGGGGGGGLDLPRVSSSIGGGADQS